MGADATQALFVQAHANEVFVYEDGLALASHEADVPGGGSGGGGERYVVEPVAARGYDDEGVGVDGQFFQRVFGLLGDDYVGVGEAFGLANSSRSSVMNRRKPSGLAWAARA